LSLVEKRPEIVLEWIKGFYYLVVNRLVPYKKVDLAISSFNRLGLPLVIVGTGSEESKLKSRAKENIMFVGEISEKEMFECYQNAI